MTYVVAVKKKQSNNAIFAVEHDSEHLSEIGVRFKI